MAKSRGPLLSLEARGSIGNVLTFNRSSRRNIVKAYHVPTGDATAAQTTQRGIPALAHWAKNFVCHGANIQTSWDTQAANDYERLSAYLLQMRAYFNAIYLKPDASFVSDFSKYMVGGLRCYLRDIDDNSTGSESGNYDVYRNTVPSPLIYFSSVANSGGSLWINMGSAGPWYFTIRRAVSGVVLPRIGIGYIDLS